MKWSKPQAADKSPKAGVFYVWCASHTITCIPPVKDKDADKRYAGARHKVLTVLRCSAERWKSGTMKAILIWLEGQLPRSHISPNCLWRDSCQEDTSVPSIYAFNRVFKKMHQAKPQQKIRNLQLHPDMQHTPLNKWQNKCSENQWRYRRLGQHYQSVWSVRHSQNIPPSDSRLWEHL